MKAEQLIQRIGNVDECLIEEAARQPGKKPKKGRGALRKVLAFAVAAALMAGSFSAGAMTTKGGEKTIVKEKIVVKEPETVVFGDSGISLILPESWAGKYGVSEREWEGGYGIEIYQLASHNEFEKYGNGAVVRLSCYEEEYSMEEEFPYMAHVIAVGNGVSYVISQPSDLQCWGQDEVWEEYHAMEESVPQIKVLFSAWMQENTINITNWEKDITIFWLKDDGTSVQWVCDEENFKDIRELVLAQDYCLEKITDFYSHLRLEFDGEIYCANMETGDIEHLGSGTRAQLSEEDLTKLKALLEEAESTSISQPGS